MTVNWKCHTVSSVHIYFWLKKNNTQINSNKKKCQRHEALTDIIDQNISQQTIHITNIKISQKYRTETTINLVNTHQKFHIRETPTVSTDADSGTDTNLKRKRDLFNVLKEADFVFGCLP